MLLKVFNILGHREITQLKTNWLKISINRKDLGAGITDLLGVRGEVNRSTGFTLYELTHGLQFSGSADGGVFRRSNILIS